MESLGVLEQLLGGVASELAPRGRGEEEGRRGSILQTLEKYLSGNHCDGFLLARVFP